MDNTLTFNPTVLFYLTIGLQIIAGLGWIWLIIYFIRREKKYMAIAIRSMIPQRTPTSSPTKRLMAALNGNDDEEKEELDYQEAIAEAERIIAESRGRE